MRGLVWSSHVEEHFLVLKGTVKSTAKMRGIISIYRS